MAYSGVMAVYAILDDMEERRMRLLAWHIADIQGKKQTKTKVRFCGSPAALCHWQKYVIIDRKSKS